MLMSSCAGAIILTIGAMAQIKTAGENPAVLDGMQIRLQEKAVVIAPGKCRVGDKVVETQETTLAIDPSDSVVVADEMYDIIDQRPQTWHSGNRLIAGRQPMRVMPGQLEPKTFAIFAETNRGGEQYEKGRDYFLDEFWGAFCREPNGHIKPNQRVPVSYTYGRRRIDRIEVTPEGQIVLRRGTPKVDCPLMPDATPGCLTLATVYRPYHARTLKAEDIFVVNPKKAADVPHPDLEGVAKTLAKLRAGQPVTVVCWGDSVTDAGDVFPVEARYVNAFATQLKKRFDKSDIKVINAGIGGTSTQGRLAAYDKEVLSFKPDLITVEFVNDMGLPIETLLANWRLAVDKARKIGAEFVIITPHFVMPSWMSKSYSRGAENRPNCQALRKLAPELKVGLADTAKRWELMEYEGAPYETYFINGINHPDARGHALFVEELMRLFPK